jgi:3-hydroxyacyl-[acyl-carrier-protein] dehydratase
MKTYQYIIDQLPYTEPFLFVDKILNLSDNAITGQFTFKPSLDFYSGHFKDQPITPGVILTECAAQIGLACLGIHLLTKDNVAPTTLSCVMTSAQVEFLKPVFPGETVKVEAVKQYFRFGKLKSEVIVYNATNEKVLKGAISGILKPKPHE